MASISGSIIFSLLLTFLFCIGIISFLTDYETGKCEMTYMFEYPQFVRISNDVDMKYKKYGLYAYSEGRLTEKARSMKFDGIPVLFIPGSGGSHKQCRSFASIALRKAINSRTRFHFDYFTVDLNNELSGLNGALLQEQLDYVNASIDTVLQLYKTQRDPPTSIVLIGHSMGGVLAKAIISQLSADSQLVPIVITLSAPLTRPVLALDYFFERFYAKMNQNFSNPDKTTFISLAGGFNDFLVPPYLTDGGDLHAVATQIPKSWVSTDHLSIVWCKQLIMAVNRALFESVDPQTKQVSKDPDRTLSIFKHHLIQHPGTRTNERIKYTKETQLTHGGEWHESMYRQYSVRLPKGTRDMRWHMLPLVMKPDYEYLTLVALDMKSVDWVYVCAAASIRNNQRFCEVGHPLTQLSEISPSARYKRRTLRINMHDLKMNYTSATHVAIRIMPTSDFMALHIDMANPASRTLTFDYGPTWLSLYPREVLRETEEKAIHYDIILPHLMQLIQSYTLHLDEVCTGTSHHATASLRVPWNHHDNHQYYTDTIKQPMTFKLYKARPANATDYASFRLTLDPTCRYKISIQSSYDLGMMVRFYMPMLIANVAAVVLMTLRSQLMHIGEYERCSFVFTALKEGAKPYYVVTTVKIISRVFSSGFLFLVPTDSQTLVDENTDILLLPLILYSTSVGIVWLSSVGLSICLVCFESTVHKYGMKFFTKTFAGRVGWTDHILKAFDKIPGLVACVLIAMSYTTCGGLAICLATIFYFLKLTQMAQDFIEDIVKGIAKSVAFKLKDKIWIKIKERWGKKTNLESTSLSTFEDSSPDDTGYTEFVEGLYPRMMPPRSVGTGDVSMITEDDDDDDFERPMEFEIQQSDNSQLVSTVDGEKLVALINNRMTPIRRRSNVHKPEGFWDGLNFNWDFAWIREAMENNEIFFHFTIFLIYLIVAALNIPSVLTWARNYKYSKSLDPDPVFIPALVLSACAAPLWQLEFPCIYRKHYTYLAQFVYFSAIVILIYGVISIYRISFILSAVVAIVALHQLLAPNKRTVEKSTIDDPYLFNERVKAKWD